MMKRWMLIVLTIVMLAGSASAVSPAEDLQNALPKEAKQLIEDVDTADEDGLLDGCKRLAKSGAEQAKAILRHRLRGAVCILLVTILCGAVSSFLPGEDERTGKLLLMAGALAVTGMTVGSFDTLIGLAAKTMQELNTFSSMLLPTLAAAAASAGAISSATFRQVTTVFCADLLLRLINEFLLPMASLYVGVLTAGCCLGEERLNGIADAIRRMVTLILKGGLLLFTGYLSVMGIFSAAVDSMTVRAAKTAISGMVPVVGGIIAEAAETLAAGAGVLRGTVGIIGILGILAVCLYPFLQIGIQYLLYRITAFLAALTAPPELSRLIDGLGGAFGLVLGMTGSCALLLLVSILASVAAVTV